LSAIDELAVGDGWPGGGSPEQEVGKIGDAPAAIEAIVPLARVARQVLGADTVKGAAEPSFHVAEQDMDDGQHSIGVFAAVAALNRRPLRVRVDKDLDRPKKLCGIGSDLALPRRSSTASEGTICDRRGCLTSARVPRGAAHQVAGRGGALHTKCREW